MASCVRRGARGRGARLSVALVALAATSGTLAAAAGSAVTPTKDATAIARAIAEHPAFVVGAELVTAPPNGQTGAISDGTLEAPMAEDTASSFAILSTGDLQAAAADADSGQLARVSNDLGGGAVRGGSERDVTTLRVDLVVPSGATCLQLDFRFLTEEWPEYRAGSDPSSAPNDAFVAELDASDWRTDGNRVVAKTFAYATGANPVSLITAGPFMSAQNAAGTRYDGAGPIRRAWVAADPGPHSVYFSIFDSLDGELDSAVFLDALQYGVVEKDSAGEEFCAQGPTLVTQTFADSPFSLVGSLNGYRVVVDSVGGPSAKDAETPSESLEAVVVEEITNSLAPGFTYVPGSTSGSTSADPTSPIDRQLLWAKPFGSGPTHDVELHFNVAVANEPGNYTSSSSAKASGHFLLSTGSSALIEVANPVADLVLTHLQTPLPVKRDDVVSVEFAVSNNGPQPATGLVLRASVPDALADAEVSSTQGSCNIDEAVVCKLGDLPVEETATVFLSGIYESDEPIAINASVGAIEADSNPGNNTLGSEPMLSAVTLKSRASTEPVVGESLKTEAASGTVRVRPPASNTFVELDKPTAIPVGSTVDARRGKVTITAAADTQGTSQAATFSGEKFVVRQRKNGLTTLKVVGGNFSKCRPRSAVHTREAQRFIKDKSRRKRVIRRMWGRGKGKFRTRGRYASATVRGTVWRTIDRCDGTLIRVKRGVVIVRDVKRGRTVKVKTGQKYFVKKPNRAKEKS